ncbi:M20/M25/M40 family metallo-hydrolase [Paraconexibacter sp. AEG42_29]
MEPLHLLVESLVAIDSVNPSLVPGGAGEAGIAAFVAQWLRAAGLEVRVDEVAPGRPNVVGVRRGTGGGRTLLLLAHTDTVGGALQIRIAGGRLHGRGAYDMKAGLAAAMSAAAGLDGLAGDVVVAAVCDEEAGGLGTRALLRGDLPFDAAVVPEPTDETVAIAHKGFAGFEIETRGVAAHGSRPDLGVDGIAAMGPVLVDLAALDARLRAGPAHPLLGTGSVHASLIAGGQEASTYPARCVLTGEWRTVPGEDPTAALEALAASHRAELRMTHTGLPFAVDPDADIVTTVVRHARTGPPAGAAFWADSALLAAAGVPTVLYGPAGGGAHAADEWVDLASVTRVRDTLQAVAREFCGS